METSGIHIGWFIGACVAAVGGILAWWGQHRYAAGCFDQWQLDVKDRFERVNERIKGIETVEQRLETLEKEAERIKSVDKLDFRVGTMEKEVAFNRDIRLEVIGLRKAFESLMELMKHKM